MTARWSLRGRLTRRVLTGLTLGWLGALLAGLFVISHEMDEVVDAGLAGQARFALLLLERTGSAAEAPLSRHEAIRITPAGAEPPPAPWPVMTEDGTHRFGAWRVYRLTSADGTASIEIGRERGWWHDEFLETARAFLLLMIPLLLVMLLVIRRTVIGSLRPLQRFSEIVRHRRADDLSPLAAEGLPEEIVPVPDALNAYLARIDALLQSERAFAGNAAHELRTPIAAASVQAQLLASGQASETTAADLVQSLARLGQLTERLLELSRAEAGIGRAGQRTDLVRLVYLLMAEFPRDSIRFDDGDFETAEVGGDADSLGILLGNLMRNAVEHGTGQVWIRLETVTDLSISNPVQPDAAFRRGRLEKGPHSQGTGIGLAIVEAISRQRGIRLDYRIAEGRAEVRLTFAPIQRT